MCKGITSTRAKHNAITQYITYYYIISIHYINSVLYIIIMSTILYYYICLLPLLSLSLSLL